VEKNLADILADKTAFNGSDIDVAISSRASALALATHDADIKSLVGTLDQSADISLSSLARSLAVWDVSTKLVALVVGDKDNPSVDEQTLLTALRKLFHVDLVDDDDVADAKMDFTAYSTIIVGYSADVAKLSALTNLAIPLVFVVGEHAATIGKMATVGAGNYGTSTGTQWSLADNSHPTLLTETLGIHDIYTQSGNFGWLLSTALASGVGVFATVQGEATHVSLAILPIDGINSDGLASPEIRYFFGAQEPSKYTSHTWDHVKWIGDWLSHQIALVTLVTSLEKSKTIEEMLGKGKFQKTRDLYDYLVTGTTGSPPFEVIAEYESRSVMERLEWIKNALRKGTGTALPANKSLYDVLALDRWDVRLDATRAAKIDNLDVTISSRASATALTTHDSDIKTRLDHATYGLAALNTDLDTLILRLGDPSPSTIKALIDSIQAKLDNGTYGLSALQTLLTAIEGTGFTKDIHSLVNITGYVDEIEGLLKNASYGLSALKTLIDAVEGKLDNATYGLNALKTLIDAVEAKLDNATYGLAALNADLDAVKAKTDLIPADISTQLDTNIPAIKTQTDKIPRILCHMDFWSDNVDEIVLTTTAGADHNLPNCVVAGLPAGITIIRVVALLKIALIKDTSGADNAINGATSLKVDASSLYDSLVTAIDIPDNSWAVDVSEATERGGDVMIGDNDIKTEVTGNATYYGQLTDIVCDGNNLKLKDLAWGLRVYFTV